MPPQLIDTIFLGDRRRRWRQPWRVIFEAQAALSVRGRVLRVIRPGGLAIVFTAQLSGAVAGRVATHHRMILFERVATMAVDGYVKRLIGRKIQFRSDPYKEELEDLVLAGLVDSVDWEDY